MTTESNTGVSSLFGHAPAHPQRLVLVLHGGQERSTEPVKARNGAYLRMLPFTLQILIAGRTHGLGVFQLRYQVRGWNDARQSPVADARVALERLHRRYPGVPVTLVGHSMGGRTVAVIADDPLVTDIVALAPWWPNNESAHIRPDQRLLVIHGTKDTWTSPVDSERQVRQAVARGVNADWRGIAGAGHFMAYRPFLWHSLTWRFIVDGEDDHVQSHP